MSKNITKSAIDWVALAKLVPPEQRNNFLAFKAKSDNYLRRVLSIPEKPPKIDWEYYKKTVPVAGMVDKFKSAYESFKVPIPKDNYTKDVDKQWASLQEDIKKHCDEMECYIKTANEELDRIKALPKFDDMTMEMFKDMYPNDAMDFVKKPSFWPHEPEEQLWYKDPVQKESRGSGGH